MNIPKNLPQELKSAVDAYLMARALAETERAKVDAIQRRILETADYWTVKDPKESWLMDENEFHDYLSDVRRELEKAGYEIETQGEHYWNYFCPALSAESLQRDAENLVIEATARMIGHAKPEEMNHLLLCHAPGLETRQKFIDLAVGLVVNFPGFKSPLPLGVQDHKG